MVISDKRFGAEILTKKGKVYKFDSIECMHRYHKKHTAHLGADLQFFFEISAKLYELIECLKAIIMEHKQIRSPMGRGYFVFDNMDALNKTIPKDQQSQKALDWKELDHQLHIDY